jgi:hypothetical protein
MESQLRDAALRLSVRELIQHGRLPLVRPEQVKPVTARGACAPRAIGPSRRLRWKYEVEDCATGSSLNFHSACHGVWQLECAEASAGRGDPGSSSAA